MLNLEHENIQSAMIYQKSLDIFQLSRRIASYITDDKDVMSMYRSGKKEDNYADNLVMNSFRLVPKVVEVEIQDTTVKKLKYAKRLRYFIERINQDCIRLEKSKISGKEFVRMLRKELRALRKMHASYIKSIVL